MHWIAIVLVRVIPVKFMTKLNIHDAKVMLGKGVLYSELQKPRETINRVHKAGVVLLGWNARIFRKIGRYYRFRWAII